MIRRFATVLAAVFVAGCASRADDYCAHLIACEWGSTTQEACTADMEKRYTPSDPAADCADVHAALDAYLDCAIATPCSAKQGDTIGECNAKQAAWIMASARTPACETK